MASSSAHLSNFPKVDDAIVHLMDLATEFGPGNNSLDVLLSQITLILIKYYNQRELSESLPGYLKWEYLQRESNSLSSIALEKAIILGFQSMPNSGELGRLKDTLSAYTIPDLYPQFAPDPFGPVLFEELDRVFYYVHRMDINSWTFEEVSDLIYSLMDLYLAYQIFDVGELTTPIAINKLIASLASPRVDDLVYDPACGNGGLLFACRDHPERDKGDEKFPQLYGEDINLQVITISRVRQFLNGEDPNSIAVADVIHSSNLRKQYGNFDVCVSHIPFGVNLYSNEGDKLHEDIRYKYGVPNRHKDYLFIQHVISSLNANGRAVILTSAGTLFRKGEEEEIRSKIITDDLIECVISLPNALLTNTSVPLALLVINKDKSAEMKGKIQFIYANEEYKSEHPGSNILKDTHIEKIVNSYNSIADNRDHTIIVPINEIAALDYNLLPSRYIDVVGIEQFLGGTAKYLELENLGNIQRGGKLGKIVNGEGIPAFKIVDLKDDAGIDNLSRVKKPSNKIKNVFTKNGDILFAAVGEKPKAIIVNEELSGILVDSNVFVLRLKKENRNLTSYILDFFKSDIGSAYLSNYVSGQVIPSWRLSDFQKLQIPIPEKSVIEILDTIQRLEIEVKGRMTEIGDIRRRLFGINEPEKLKDELNRLLLDAQVLSQNIIKTDDLDFQISNYYPYPVAYAYTYLNTYQSDEALYNEQLRLVENMLAYMAVLGLAMLKEGGLITTNDEDSHSYQRILECFKGGASQGDWHYIAYSTAKVLRGEKSFSAMEQFGSLWFKGKGKKTSDVYQEFERLVAIINKQKHGQGPKTTQEVREQSKNIQALVDEIISNTTTLIQFPLTFVDDLDIDRSGKSHLSTRQYMGDHPGKFSRENILLEQPLPKKKLYIRINSDKLVSLYPLITADYCPQCGREEVLFLDKWNGKGRKGTYRSFERGHVIPFDVGDRYYEDLCHWFMISDR